jgi:hypothetical protein
LPNSDVQGVLVVPAGSLDTEIPMVPTAHIFSSRKASWEEDAGEVPSFRELPA